MSNLDSIGLIPAAGRGERLNFPFPKELYPIIENNHYKPVSNYILQNIVKAGVNHIVIVINDTKHQLIKYFGNGSRFGCNISYVVQEFRVDIPEITKTPGLAEAMDTPYHLTKDKIVYFGMADTIIKPVDFFETSSKHLTSDVDVILCMFHTDRKEKAGMVELGNNNIVKRIVDKPESTTLEWMWGAMIWKPIFTDFFHECIHKRNITDYAEIYNKAIESGVRFKGLGFKNGKYLDMGTYNDVLRLNNWLNNKK
jgi:glucose-1-phosphate thymidylyltransferase